ncbi:hypothetical protein LINPERPRIM_LOCUS36462 [Linum perenne]
MEKERKKRSRIGFAKRQRKRKRKRRKEVDRVDCILRSLLCNRESVGDGASVLLAALSSAVDGDLIIAGAEYL